jgi:Mor family transcriptional regulator
MSREKENDVVLRFVEIVQQCTGGIDEQVALQIEAQIRNEYGGDEPYIARARWRDIEERDRMIATDPRSVREIALDYGLSKTTVARIKARYA